MNIKADFYNIKLDLTDREDVLRRCLDFYSLDKPHTIFFLNAHYFNIAQKNKYYKQVINEADLLLNDGIGIKIASLLSGIKLKDNLNGTDIIPVILSLASKNKKKIFFLGGFEGVAEKASIRIKESIPGIHVAGYHSGYFSEKEERTVLEQINDSGAELLILGMGVPKQELWASRNKTMLTNTKIIIAGGAILDFISGRVKRAPLWIRKLNIEWTYRLYKEPGRMWKRYIIGNFVFFYHLIKIKMNR